MPIKSVVCIITFLFNLFFEACAKHQKYSKIVTIDSTFDLNLQFDLYKYFRAYTFKIENPNKYYNNYYNNYVIVK